MAVPKFYYANLLARGVLTGSNTDPAFPVRRVSDGDADNGYPLVSGETLGGPLSGELRVTLPSAETRTHFGLVAGAGLSGVDVEVWSEDVGGGNAAQHLAATLSGDGARLEALSGVSIGRRVWRATFTGISGGAVPEVNEAGFFKEVEMPARPSVGIGRSILQRVSRMEIPGGAPFRFRLGEEIESFEFSVTATGDDMEPFKAFLRENDGGEPFLFDDGEGGLLWAEIPDARHAFSDRAGVETLNVTVLEIPGESG